MKEFLPDAAENLTVKFSARSANAFPEESDEHIGLTSGRHPDRSGRIDSNNEFRESTTHHDYASCLFSVIPG